MLMHKIKGLILDLDDTLYPEIDYIKSGFHAVSRYVATNHDDEDTFYSYLLRNYTNGVGRKNFNLLKKDFDLDCSEEILIKIFRKHEPRIECFPDALHFLKSYTKKIPLILLTNGSKTSQNLKIDSLGVRKYFHSIYITDEYGKDFWKPSSRIYHRIVKECGIEASSIGVIGDNPARDFIAPNRMNMETIRISRPSNIFFSLRNNGISSAKYTLSNFDELTHLIQEKGWI